MTVIAIHTEEDLARLLDEYGCASVDWLGEVLSENGIILQDLRPNAEFSQCEAQNSPEFADEAVTEDEFEELQNLRAVYHES